MDSQLFADLRESMEQMEAISRGERAPSRVIRLASPPTVPSVEADDPAQASLIELP